jgi:integral membrane sensor domain MASE1
MINNSYAWMGGQWWISAVLAVLVVVAVVIKKLFRRK